jgi:hypothetical protein
MIKSWNRMINDYFMSFHLEEMVLQLLRGVKISDFPSGVRYFFDKARTYVTQKNPDPAGYTAHVGSYLNTRQKVDDAVSRLDTAYDRALKAENLGQAYQAQDAIDKLRQIFGGYFPSYG